MNPVSDEMLMAYADGELTSEESRALEQLLQQDPALRARLEPFVETRVRLTAAFEHTLREPVPHRLVAAIRRAPVAGRASRARLSLGERIRNALTAAAAILAPANLGLIPSVAASMAGLVLVGAAAGWIAARSTAPSSLIEASGPDLVAAGALAHALEANPSGTASAGDGRGATVVPVLSFKTGSQAVCREYRVRTADADRDFAGLACRSADGVWRVALHVETAKQVTASPGAPYETATASNVPAVDALVETMISGESFGQDDEAALLNNGWRAPLSVPAPTGAPNG